MIQTPGLHIVRFLLLCLGFIWTGPLYAQIPFAFTNRPQGNGMRTAALADATGSDPADVTAMYLNPGSINFILNPSLVVTHVIDRTTGAQTEHAVVSLIHGGPFALAVAGMYSHEGELRPEGDVAVGFKEYGIDLATSIAVTPTLSVGIFAGGRQIQFGEITKPNGWAQVGMFYYPSPGISYGWAYRVSSGVSYWSANAQRGVINEPNLFQNLEISATMTYPSRSNRPIVTLTLASEKYFPGVSRFSTKGGLEVYPVSFIALRVGFKVGTVEHIARYGVGFRFDPVQVDLTVGPSRSENRFGGASFSISL